MTPRSVVSCDKLQVYLVMCVMHVSPGYQLCVTTNFQLCTAQTEPVSSQSESSSLQITSPALQVTTRLPAACKHKPFAVLRRPTSSKDHPYSKRKTYNLLVSLNVGTFVFDLAQVDPICLLRKTGNASHTGPLEAGSRGRNIAAQPLATNAPI